MARSTAAEARDPALDLSTAIERYRDHWVGHVIVLGDHLSRRLIERLEQECGYARIRPSLGPFISLVWREPRPLVELAGQLAISRQACSKIARQAEEDGYVERVQAQKGDRAQSVRLTKHGSRLAEDSVRLVLEEQATFEAWVGGERLRRFNAATSAVFRALGLEAQTDAGLGKKARRSIGILPVVADRIELELRERTRAKGHEGLQLSHARLIGLIGDGARSVSEMARHQGVSRQATGATVRSLESLAYVRRDSDEHDARAIRVRLSERGEALVLDTVTALEELGDEFRRAIGPRRFDDFANIAAELRGALAAEAELFETGDRRSRRTGPIDAEKNAPRDLELQAIAALLAERLGEKAANRLGRMLCA
ncbi:MAG: MarR family transcriptional regulator [Myxococcota bacterium]